jgi:hypothetical protein
MTYYIRVRGRVQGPFDDDKLRELIRRGQFSRMHEVSTDGQSWSSAKDFPELFAKAANVSAGKVAPEQSEYAIQPSAPSGPSKSSFMAGPAPPASDGWYFAIGDKQQGPVDYATLSHLFSSGQLNAESQVWRDGMGNWTSARNVEALNSLLFQARPSAERNSAAATSRGDEMPLSVATAASSAKGWVVFIFLSGYVASVLHLLGSIATLIIGSKTNASILVAQGLSGMIFAVAILVGAILLSHYSSAVSRFTVQRGEKDLCDVFFSLSRIWTYCGVALALAYALLIILILLVVALTPNVFSPNRLSSRITSTCVMARSRA